MPKQSLFIYNRWIEGSGKTFSSFDPATDEIIWEGRAASPEEVRMAVDAAAAAFEGWVDLEADQRMSYIEAFRDQLVAERDGLAQAICLDTGKPKWEALSEVDAMIGKVSLSFDAYYLRCGPIQVEYPGGRAFTRFKPHGIMAVLGPFNLPGHLPNGHIVPALLAGNTVVFKPSSLTPLVAQMTMELWERAGPVPGVINLVQGDRATGNSLLDDPRIAGVLFTGSAEVGTSLSRRFGGEPGKILALEMGGNNPLVVHEVEDVTAAAYLTIQSAFITAGQRCTCARRLVVPRGSEGDRFVEAVVNMSTKIRVGRCTDAPEPYMGPVISNQAADRLLVAQTDLASRNGDVLLEMRRLDRPGCFLSPGVMDVSRVQDRADVELFGPFLQVIRSADFDEAIHEANATSFGLAAGFLSDNEELFQRFWRRIRAGVVNWNRQTTGASGKMAFGGVRGSGNHRPSGFFASDYCSYPVASIEVDRVTLPQDRTPGIDL